MITGVCCFMEKSREYEVIGTTWVVTYKTNMQDDFLLKVQTAWLKV